MENRQRKLQDDPTWTIESTTFGKGRNRILDYGCGKGFDAFYMNADRYDPHFFPLNPEGPYEIIFCTYVLNVMDRYQQFQVLRHIDSLLSEGGVSYVTVRRDKGVNPLGYTPHDGYCQYYVWDGDMRLHGYRSVYTKKNAFEIYVKGGYGDY